MPNLYLYGLINSSATASTAASGVSNIRPYVIPFKDIGIIAGTYTSENIDINLDNLSKHDEVICELSGNFCVLPIPFGTIVKNEQSISTFISQNYDQINLNFEKLMNKHEMGLKIIWDIDKIRQEISFEEPIKASFNPDSPAKSYLHQKLLEYDSQNKLQEKAEVIKRKLINEIENVTTVYNIKLLQSEKMVVNGAFLIATTQKEQFINSVEKFKEFNKDLHFLISGPWVPYNFVEMPNI